MKESKHYYTGMGMILGTGIAGAVCMTLFILSGNPLFIPFIGLGTGLGLVFGAGIDQRKGKKS
ncbi:MAG: hypothetical protein ACLFRY_11015 [Spirochaetia bacterium]